MSTLSNEISGLTLCLGPCFGGIIVTFSQWRVIFWLQFGMALLGLVLSLLFVPNLEKEKEIKESRTVSSVLKMFNPLHIFRPLIYPNIFLCVSPNHLRELGVYSSKTHNDSISHAASSQHSNTRSSHLPALSLTHDFI